MLPYIQNPKRSIAVAGTAIQSFVAQDDANVDWAVVEGFGEEWLKFNHFGEDEINKVAAEYFDIVTPAMLHKESVALDVGCGTGRWSYYVSQRAGFVEAVDPSQAVHSAAHLLRACSNVRITQASVNNLPFAPDSFDYVFSLGVLHHIPDTQQGIDACVAMLKPGGWLHLYLYYSLDNRGFVYRLLFGCVNALRRGISSLPAAPKKVVCDVLAVLIYMPLVLLARACYAIPVLRGMANKIPLAYYRDKSWHIIRNDALDRFGTRLEQRFSKAQIAAMLTKAGLANAVFSDGAPYWHCVAQKPT